MQRHVDYAQRHGVDKDGGPARPFTDTGELTREQTSQFVDRAEPDRHSFRFIVSPEDGANLNLESYTRDLMQQMEQDLGTKLDWMAVATMTPTTRTCTSSCVGWMTRAATW